MIEPEILEELTELLGEAPRVIVPLAGATSSKVYRLELADRALILRLFLAERWDADAETLSTREHVILSALAGRGLPAPHPVATLPGNGVLMTVLPGRVVLPERPDARWLDRMAALLQQIHACGASVPYAYESWNDVRDDQPPPAWWRDADLWTAARQLARNEPAYEPLFTHRDYHPVNLLWQGGRISGVVDWINACMGPPGVDVAHCRANLAIMYGLDVSEAFLQAYARHAVGYVHEPYWDVDVAFSALPDVAPYPPWAEFGLDTLTPEMARRRLEAFIRAAVSR
jgi:Ser/Thr protein kinase RdoA (MazF antagonist)